MNEVDKKMALTPQECSTIQIYYDCKTIKSLYNSIKENYIAGIALIPYMSLFCWEAVDFFKKLGIDFNAKENDKFTLTDVRLKLKIFENKYSKAKNMILNCNYLQDYIFKNKLKFNFMKDWNIHYNLGIMFNDKKEIVGNSQYGYYIFQDNKLLKRKIEYVKSLVDTSNIIYEFAPEDYFGYGKYIGEIVGSFLNFFEELNVANTNIKTDKANIDMFYKDFNSNRLYKSEDDKIISLYLLHILTFINSTIRLLGECEKDDTGGWLRIYYIAYYYAVERLEDIKNYIENNEIDNLNLKNLLIKINLNKSFMNSEFRSCMMHYGLINKENKFLIKEQKFNLDIPMMGLVESCFDNVNYFELKKYIKDELENISQTIDNILNINKFNLEKF